MLIVYDLSVTQDPQWCYKAFAMFRVPVGVGPTVGLLSLTLYLPETGSLI